jgi:hypothetical protein
MRILLISLVVLFQFQLSGCAATGGTKAKTADEYRNAPDRAVVQTFEVDRGLKDVAAALKKRASKCLDVTIQRSTAKNIVIANWNPTLIVGKDKAELHLQRIRENGEIDIQGMPEKGDFVMVMDAVPLTSNKTRIDLYKQKGGDEVVQAIKDWAAGNDNTSCPDMIRADREMRSAG